MIPHIQIRSTPAAINVQTNNATLDIHQQNADLSIKQPVTRVQIKRTPGRMTIDQTEAWNNLNLKSIMTRLDDAANMGREAVLAGIARRAEEGRQMMEIEKGGNAIAQISKQRSVSEHPYDTGSVPPFQAVRLNYEPASVKIDWNNTPAEISSTPHPPEYQYTRGDVSITPTQYASVEIIPPAIDESV